MNENNDNVWEQTIIQIQQRILLRTTDDFYSKIREELSPKITDIELEC